MQEIGKSGHYASIIFGELLDSQTVTDCTRPEGLLSALMNNEELVGAPIDILRKKFSHHNEKIRQLYENKIDYEQHYFSRAEQYYGLKGKKCGYLWGKKDQEDESPREQDYKIADRRILHRMLHK